MVKKVTMKDIAGKLGVSINAVSLALNDRAGIGEKTRRLILNTAEDMGYLDQTKIYLGSYSNKNLCVLLRSDYFKDMQFYGRILLGLEEAAKGAGYDVVINSFIGRAEIPACVENHKVAGIIVVGKISDEFLIRLKKYKLPVILVDHTSLLESTDSVLSDNKLGAFKSVKYLIDSGYTKIGFFGGLDYSHSIQERFGGYEEALRRGMKFKTYSELTQYVKQYSLLDGIEEHVINRDAGKIEEVLLRLESYPEVFICSNDKAAIILTKALSNMGIRIPDEIGIVGFDDIALAEMVTPPLTTVHVDKELMGRLGVERFLHRLQNPTKRIEKITMDVKIVERGSVKIPRV